MLHDFYLAEKRIRLWQRTGESYEHVLMKALGFAMFFSEYPQMEIETKVGLRYKPDLVARGQAGEFLFWGEAGSNSLRKTAWLLKHTETRVLVLFKIGQNSMQFVEHLRAEIPEKYRPENRFFLVNFAREIVDLTASKEIAKVSDDWFTKFEI